MNPTKPNESEAQQQEQPASGGNYGQPQAASKRDVQEAERKAEDAQQTAREAQKVTAEESERLDQRCEELRQENEALRALLERTVAAVRRIDENLDKVEEGTRGMGGYYESEEIADSVELPTYEELEPLTVPDEEE